MCTCLIASIFSPRREKTGISHEVISVGSLIQNNMNAEYVYSVDIFDTSKH